MESACLGFNSLSRSHVKGKGLLHFYGFGTENQHELENRIPSLNGSFIWMDSCTDKHLSHELKTNTQTLDCKAWGYFLHKVWQRSQKHVDTGVT